MELKKYSKEIQNLIKKREDKKEKLKKELEEIDVDLKYLNEKLKDLKKLEDETSKLISTISDFKEKNVKPKKENKIIEFSDEKQGGIIKK